MTANEGLIVGEDGKRRCRWGGSTPEYALYHDREWGRPVVDDTRLFEKICLEGFQSGLSWLTILRKREISAPPSPASTSWRASPASPRATSTAC